MVCAWCVHGVCMVCAWCVHGTCLQVECLEEVGAGPPHTSGAAGVCCGGACLPQPLRRRAVAILELDVRGGHLDGHSRDHARLHVPHPDQADLDVARHEPWQGDASCTEQRAERAEAPLWLLAALRAATPHVGLLRLLLGAQLEGHQQPAHRDGPCAGARVLGVHLEDLRRIWAEEVEPLGLRRLLRAGAEVVVVVGHEEVLDRAPRSRGCKAEADDLRCGLVAEKPPQQTRVAIVHDERDLRGRGRGRMREIVRTMALRYYATMPLYHYATNDATMLRYCDATTMLRTYDDLGGEREVARQLEREGHRAVPDGLQRALDHLRLVARARQRDLDVGVGQPVIVRSL